MKSIQTKFAGIIAIALTIQAITIGICLFVVMGRITSEDSTKIISTKCEEKAENVNSKLQLVSQSVEIISAYAERSLESASKISDKAYYDRYMEDVLKLADEVANIAGTSVEYYYRLAPELTNSGTSGFFRQKKADNDSYTECPTTNLYAFPETDTAAVGWYYEPKKAGKAIWLEPYFNVRVQDDMIAYVSPIYKDGVFIGVIGMDVDFSDIVEYAENIDLYKSGYARLVSQTSGLAYYKMNSDRVWSEELPDKFITLLNNFDDGKQVVDYNNSGDRLKVAHSKLDNGMTLFAVAHKSEINEERRMLLFEGSILTFIILLASIAITSMTSKRIAKPLKELTKAAQSYADGNWDVEVYCDTRDEVKLLTDSITKMARSTQNYITRINTMAFQDSLTKLKNKAGYLDFVDGVKANVGKEWKEYSIVIFDINYFKETTDNYGYEIGDKLLIFAAKYICDIFRHSPVFRVGGDEFVAILKGPDYENRENLFSFFKENAKKMVVDKDLKLYITIAAGMSSCPAQGTNYDELFEAATEAMQKNKEELKKNQ